MFFSITVPAARAQELEPLRAAAERAVKAIPGVAGAMVALTAEKKGGGMEAPVKRPPPPPGRSRAAPSRPRLRRPAAPHAPALAQHRAKRGVPGIDAIIAGRLRQGRRRQVHHRGQHRAGAFAPTA